MNLHYLLIGFFILAPQAGATTYINCLNKNLPFMLGTSEADTYFTHMADMQEYYTTTVYSYNFIGGHTFDPRLVEDTTTSGSLTNSRAFILRYKIPMGSAMTSNEPQVEYYKYFQNNADIATVEGLYYVGYSSSSSYQAVVAIVKSADGLTSYLVSMTIQLTTYKQYKIGFSSDSGSTQTTKQFTFWRQSLTVFQASTTNIYFILNRQDALNPSETTDKWYTSIAQLYWFTVKSSNTGTSYETLQAGVSSVTTNQHRFFRMDCLDATGPFQCNGHSLVRYSSQEMLFAGVKTTSDGSGKYILFLYHLDSDLLVLDQVELDSGKTISADGTDYYYLSKMAVFNDYVWIASGSQNNYNHFLFRYQVGTSGAGNDPIAFQIEGSSQTTETLNMYAVSEDQMYELRKDSADRITINHYTFDETSSAYSYVTAQIQNSGTSPFTSSQIMDASFLYRTGTTDPTKFLIIGTSNTFASSAFTVSFTSTNSRQHGFIFSLNTDDLPACYTSLFTMGTVSNTLTALPGLSWTRDTSSPYQMTEIDDSVNTATELLTLIHDSLAETTSASTSMSAYTTLETYMTDGTWCTNFEKYNIQIQDRSTDTSLDLLIDSSYPDFVINTFCSTTSCRYMSTTSHPFKIEENFGPSSDLICSTSYSSFEWTYSWSLDLNGVTYTDTYPSIYRYNYYGNNQRLRIDWDDPTGTYIGNSVLTITATLPYNKGSDSTTINVRSVTECESTNNQLYLYNTNSNVIIIYLISNQVDQNPTYTTNDATLQVNCPYSTVWGFQVYDAAGNIDLTTHILGTTQNFMTFSTSDAQSLTITVRGMDTDTYPNIYEDLMSLRGSYKFRLTGINEYNILQGASDFEYVNTWRWIYVRGCKIVYPATYTSGVMTGIANNHYPLVASLSITYQILTSDYELKQGFWETDPDPVITCYSPLYFEYVYISSEDGSTTTYTDWASKIELNYIQDGTPTATNSYSYIKILNSGFSNNEYAGMYHDFYYKVKSRDQYNNYYPYQPFQTLRVTISKNCDYAGALYQTSANAAAYASLTGSMQIYQLTDPQLSFNFDQFLTVDAWCNQVVSLSATKSGAAGDQSSLVSNFLTFTVETNQFDISLKHLIQIESSNEAHFGNFTITVSSAVTEGGSSNTDSFSFDLWMKHWCWLLIYDMPLQSASEYFIYDPDHPEVVAMGPTLTKSLGHINPQVTVSGSLKSFADIATNCGTLTLEPEVVKIAGDPAQTIDSTVYTFDSSVNTNVKAIISTSDKAYLVPTAPSNWSMTETINMKVYFANYPDVASSLSFDMSFKDPCLSLYIQQNPNDTIQTGDTVSYRPVDDPQNHTIQIPIPWIIDNSGSRLENGYCGTYSYTMVYQNDSITPYDPEVFNWFLDDDGSTFHFDIYTKQHSYSNTIHKLQLIATNNEHPDYPKGFVNFTVDLSFCTIESLIKPKIQTFAYIFRTGLFYHMSDDSYLQVPNCKFEPVITSTWANGTAFNPYDMQLRVNPVTKILEYTLNFTDRFQAGTYSVMVNYEVYDNGVLWGPVAPIYWELQLIWRKFLVSNNPPYFVDEKKPLSLVYLDLDAEEQYEFDTGPASEDTVKLSFSVVSDSLIWTEFIKVDIDELNWSAAIKIKPTERRHRGKYEVRLQLLDNGSDRKEGLTDYETALPVTATVKIPIEVYSSNYVQQEEIKNGTLNESDYTQCTTECPPKIRIKEISRTGDVELAFNQRIIVPGDYKKWKGVTHSSTFDAPKKEVLSIIIYPGRRQNASALDASWEIKDFQPYSMTITLNFTDALRVSMAETMDEVAIVFRKKEKFIALNGRIQLLQKQTQAILPRQVPIEKDFAQGLTNTAQSVEVMMKSSMIMHVLLNVVLPGSLQQLWSLVNHLQIVFHIPGANVKMPGNCEKLFSVLISITQFKVFPEEYIQYFYFWNYFVETTDKFDEVNDESRRRVLTTSSTLDSDLEQLYQEEEGASESYADKREQESVSFDDDHSEENGTPIPYQVHENTALCQIGYESRQAIDNLETVFIFIMIYIISCILFIVLKPLKKYWPQRFKSSYRKLKLFLFWNTFFRFMLEGGLELCIVCFINLKSSNISMENLHENVSVLFSVVMLTVIVVFPLYMIYFVCKTSEYDLENDEELWDRKGTMYENLKWRDKVGLTYNIVFFYRRFMMGVILVFMIDLSWMQIYSNFVISIAYIMYVGNTKPWVVRFSNRLELFNEFTNLITCYHMMLFSEIYQNYEVRYSIIGVSLIICTYAVIAFNTGIVIQKVVQQCISERKMRKSKERYMAQEKMLIENYKEEMQKEAESQKNKQAGTGDDNPVEVPRWIRVAQLNMMHQNQTVDISIDDVDKQSEQIVEEIGPPIRNTHWICGDNNHFAKFVRSNRLRSKDYAEEKPDEWSEPSEEESDYGQNDTGFVIQKGRGTKTPQFH